MKHKSKLITCALLFVVISLSQFSNVFAEGLSVTVNKENQNSHQLIFSLQIIENETSVSTVKLTLQKGQIKLARLFETRLHLSAKDDGQLLANIPITLRSDDNETTLFTELYIHPELLSSAVIVLRNGVRGQKEIAYEIQVDSYRMKKGAE